MKITVLLFLEFSIVKLSVSGNGQCSVPKVPNTIPVKRSHLEKGDKVKINCKPGFKLVTGSNLKETCSFSCREITCPSIDHPEHGTSTCYRQTSRMNTTCEIACDEGFKLIGKPSVACTKNESWDYTGHKCEQITCLPIVLPNGNSTCEKIPTNYGDICKLSCIKGFYLNGSSTTSCGGDGGSITGKWNDLTQTCESTSLCTASLMNRTDICHVYKSKSGLEFCLSKKQMIYSDAIEFCRVLGAELAAKAIRSVAEMKYLMENLISKVAGEPYIGMNDIKQEGKFMFIDGVESSSKNTKWAPDQPDNWENDENCAQVTKNGDINDIPCTYLEFVLCEQIPMVQKTIYTEAICASLSPPLNGKSYCSSDPLIVGGSCKISCDYGFFVKGDKNFNCTEDVAKHDVRDWNPVIPDESTCIQRLSTQTNLCTVYASDFGKDFCLSKEYMNFENAQKFCSDLNATLAMDSVRNITRRKALVDNLLPKPVEAFVGAKWDKNKGVVNWLDGITDSESNAMFAAEEPNGSGDCVQFIYSQGELDDVYCDLKKYALCEQNVEG